MVMARPVILVIEDDPATRELLRDLLEAAGYAVERAADGEEGLARVREGGIDLVLLDLMLPNMNGLEVCRRLRADHSDVYLPVIMLTAVATDEKRHDGFAAGADDFIAKPFALHELLDRVQVWLQTRLRLETAHNRLRDEQDQRRDLEQRALREQMVQDQAVLAMARTASHELGQPLTVLVGILELWQAGYYSAGEMGHLREELSLATADLAERVDALSRVVRYETRELAGFPLIDLARAQAAPSAASA